METVLSYTDDTIWFSSDERRWIHKIRKWVEQYPELITIIRMPEENDGCIYVKFPKDWLKIYPGRGIRMSEEERSAMAARLRNSRKNHPSDERNGT